MEKAKWLWEKGYNDEAISLLEREMQVHFSDVVKLKTDTSEQAKAKRRVCAQVCLFCRSFDTRKPVFLDMLNWAKYSFDIIERMHLTGCNF